MTDAHTDLGGARQFESTIKSFESAFRQSGADVVYANTLQSFWAIAASLLADARARGRARLGRPGVAPATSDRPSSRLGPPSCQTPFVHLHAVGDRQVGVRVHRLPVASAGRRTGCSCQDTLTLLTTEGSAGT